LRRPSTYLARGSRRFGPVSQHASTRANERKSEGTPGVAPCYLGPALLDALLCPMLRRIAR
jgi:hypothetical protein